MADSACRVCLVDNIRMVIIHDNHLLKAFEQLTDTKLDIDMENVMPSTICYVCHQELQNFYNLCQTALRTKRILETSLLKASEEAGKATVTAQCPEVHNLCMKK